MQVLKSFRRDGILYTPGNDVPPGLDAVTINHYRHHGMIGESAEAKPAGQRRRAMPKPAETKPATPQQPLAADVASSDAAVHTSAHEVADPANGTGAVPDGLEANSDALEANS